VEALAGKAVSGLAWGALGGLIGKAAGFAVQIYLGWILTQEDFALYAIVTACTTVTAGLVNGGPQRILLQRNARYAELFWVVLVMSFGFNALVCMLLAGAALPMAHLYHASSLAPMLAIIGVATVVSTPGYVFHAKLSGQLRFATIQRLAICSHIVRNASTALFAFFGLGALSFVLPVLVIAVTDTLLAWRVVGPLPKHGPIHRRLAWDILRDSRWMMVGTFAAALIQNGSNMGVSLVGSARELGVYFFGFQLTFALASLLGGSLQQVMVPTLVRMESDAARQRSGFGRAVSATAVASSLLAVALIVAAPAMISLLWDGKWNDAIVVVQILALGIPGLMISWIARAAVEARGAWRTLTVLAVAEGVATVGAALLGALAGGLALIAALVAGVKLVAAVIQLAIAARRLGGGFTAVLRPFLSAQVAAIVAMIMASILVSGHPWLAATDIAAAVLTLLTALPLAFAGQLLLCRNGTQALICAVRHIVPMARLTAGKTP